MTIISFNYSTDTAQPLTDDDGKPAGWMFTLRGYSNLTLLESAAKAVARTRFDGKKLVVKVLEDSNPSKNKMKGGGDVVPKKRGRPSKEELMNRARTL